MTTTNNERCKENPEKFRERKDGMKSLLLLTMTLLVACACASKKKATSDKKDNSAISICLPEGVAITSIVSYGQTDGKNLTVEEKLDAIGAHCENGKLVDADKKEIRFFKPQCWGNRPFNYQEIRQQESEELENLKKQYAVIVLECNPAIQ
jgi:hypothetical protein